MKITIHRGTNEIGGSCVELSSGNTRILVDFGMPLVGKGGTDFNERELEGKTIPQIINEKILYPIEGLYKNQKPQFDAVLISHSHKDHYGFLKYVHPEIPIYINEGAKKLIDVLSIFTKEKFKIEKFKPLLHRETFLIGSDFIIKPYLVDHSGFGAMSFLIVDKKSDKRVFYSGDFRSTGRKGYLFEQFLKNPPRNVDCLLMEGTMIGREDGKYSTEESVCSEITDIVKSTDKKTVFVFASRQNIDRICSLYIAARETNSLLVIDSYTACVLHSIKDISKSIPQFSWRNIRIFIENYYGKGDIFVAKLKNTEYKYLIKEFGRRKIMALEIGNENQKSIILMRNSMIPAIEKIPNIKDSTVIYSQWKGYVEKKNETAETFKKFIKTNNLKIKFVHTSGHAVVEDLKRFENAIKPKRTIPIHTFHKEEYKNIFPNVLELED